MPSEKTTSSKNVDLLYQMSQLVQGDGFDPHEAFERVADGACISGKKRKKLWKS